MVKNVTWPHELLYTHRGQPIAYQDLSFNLFVTGYWAVMETVKPNLKPVMIKHLKELIADMEMYRWALIRAYYQVWLQHIENGQAKWIEAKAKLEFHRVLVWHSTPSTTKNKHAHATLPPKKAESLRSNTMIMAKLGTIALPHSSRQAAKHWWCLTIKKIVTAQHSSALPIAMK